VGVLYDYFRAPDESAVAELMKASRGSSPVLSRVADGVDAKGIEPATVGRLVAFVLDLPFNAGLIEIDEIWRADDDEDSDGPWVVSLGDQVRDSLAGIDDLRLPHLAVWWSQTEELARTSDPEFLRSILTDLVGLAHRAAIVGDHLYCWMCL
jgi:hypothetical protein